MSEYYEQPTILSKTDIGDEDCRLWVIEAGYKDQTVEISDRDWMRGERLAIEAVKAKVAALCTMAEVWVVVGQGQVYGPFATEAQANTVRVYNTSGWGTVEKRYPCPRHPDVLREHSMQICHKCEAEIDAAVMHTINDPARPTVSRPTAPARTPDTDHDFFEME